MFEPARSIGRVIVCTRNNHADISGEAITAEFALPYSRSTLQDLAAIASDASKLVGRFWDSIHGSAPQVYLSISYWVPRNSLVWKNVYRCFGDHVDPAVCKALCFFEWCRYVFYACYVALGYAPGEVHADGTWAAADVENGHVGFDVWE